MMKFLVLSQNELKNYVADQQHILISIDSPGAFKFPIPHSGFRLDVLHLTFHDVDRKVNEDVELITPLIAKAVLNFVNKYKEKVSLIICQCEAGISRSAGVAGALSKILNGEDFYIFNHYHPNMLVYRTILNEANKQKEE